LLGGEKKTKPTTINGKKHFSSKLGRTTASAHKQENTHKKGLLWTQSSPPRGPKKNSLSSKLLDGGAEKRMVVARVSPQGEKKKEGTKKAKMSSKSSVGGKKKRTRGRSGPTFQGDRLREYENKSKNGEWGERLEKRKKGRAKATF